MIKKYICLFSFFLAFQSFLFISSAQAATIRISAPKVELELAPGETYSGEMTAENPENEEIKTKIYLEDWSYKEGGTGEKNFNPPGSTPLSASKWITFTPAEETMKPFGRVTVRYTIAVPQDAKGGYYSVLFFETLLGNTKDDEGVNVMVAARIGSLFYVHVKGSSEIAGDVKSVDVQLAEGNKPYKIITTFQNTGTVDVTVGGTFLIIDKDGKIVGRGDMTKMYTFPGDTVTRETDWVGRLAKGTYQFLLTYDLGKGKNLVEEKNVTVQ